MFSAIDYSTAIGCEKHFYFDHLQDELTFFCDETDNVISIDSQPREISVELFEAAREFIQHEFPTAKLMWRTRTRAKGQKGELYSKFPFHKDSPEQRILSEVAFFPEIKSVATKKGYVYTGPETSVTFLIFDEDSNEVYTSPMPSTWCELAEKLYEGCEGWFLSVTVTENESNRELVTMFVGDRTELAKAKLTIDLYCGELK